VGVRAERVAEQSQKLFATPPRVASTARVTKAVLYGRQDHDLSGILIEIIEEFWTFVSLILSRNWGGRRGRKVLIPEAVCVGRFCFQS
jgi:hypothetical protein